MRSTVKGLSVFLFLVSQLALAGNAAVPVCPSYGRPLPINNDQVLHWKRTTPNQFRERGNVKGPITRIFPDATGHAHFEIQIGHRNGETLEVIYNTEFGALPKLAPGMTVQACGDYITASAQAGPYPPSPSGAIIHWVHMNPKGRGHDPGFVMVDGVLYGQDAEGAGPGRRYTRTPSRPHSGSNAESRNTAINVR